MLQLTTTTATLPLGYCLERELHGTASHPGVVFGVDGMIGTLICKNVDFFW